MRIWPTRFRTETNSPRCSSTSSREAKDYLADLDSSPVRTGDPDAGR